MNREAFELALDKGHLQIRGTARWYTVRRNGRTRRWKRDPARFEIPLKYAFRDYYTVTDQDFNRGTVDRLFRVAPQ